MSLTLRARRAVVLDGEEHLTAQAIMPPDEFRAFEFQDLVYRTLCAILFNFVPTFGHPGGSISNGRAIQGLLYNELNLSVPYPLLSIRRPR